MQSEKEAAGEPPQPERLEQELRAAQQQLQQAQSRSQ
jgi:hypothetical protein